MRLAFSIAVRFLKSSKGQTLLIALGIAVGVSVQIFIGSLIQGLQISLVDKTIGNSPQISIIQEKGDKTIEDYKEIVEAVKNSNEDIINLSTAVDGPALIQEDNNSYSVLVRGMNIEESDQIYNIKERIYEGTTASNHYEVVIGKQLQEELDAHLNDEIEILTNAGSMQTLKIVGFYNLNVASLNKSWIITTMDTAQMLFGLEGKITGIEMQIKDVFLADTIASEIQNNLNNDLTVNNWKDQNAELLSGLNGQSISSYMIQVFVLVAVVLGIASVLAITVMQKSKQIGILKAMGIKDKTASQIFLFEGLLLGIMGAVLGVLLGLGLSYIFTKFALNPDGTPVVNLYLDSGFIAISTLIAILSAMGAALIPARRSSKLNPMEVIKNG